MQIYGFDVLKEVETGNYYIVDFNLFPSFKGCKDYEISMANMIKKSLSSIWVANFMSFIN